jgi:hypothetical protein
MQPPHRNGSVHTGQELKDLVVNELDHVVASNAFRNSRQGERMLRYVVAHSLEKREDALRERAIGVEVFGREPKYDTSADSIVRVWANELRKRLARYYLEEGKNAPVRLSIPPGSYEVEFQLKPSSPSRPLRPSHWLIALAVLLIAVIAGAVLYRRPSALDRFWGPALTGRTAAVIYAPRSVVYRYSRQFENHMSGRDVPHTEWLTVPLSVSPDQVIRGRDIIPIPDQYIGLGSAHAIAELSAFFSARSRPTELRLGDNVSFEEFRHSAAILIGASFANRWTLQLTADLPFTVCEHDGLIGVADHLTGKSWMLTKLAEDGKTPEDYVIVSRVIHPQTGHLLVSLAGLTQYGTRAAGEFVTDPALLDQAVSGQPHDWFRRNLQVVLHVPIVQGVAGRPSIVAVRVW